MLKGKRGWATVLFFSPEKPHLLSLWPRLLKVDGDCMMRKQEVVADYGIRTWGPDRGPCALEGHSADHTAPRLSPPSRDTACYVLTEEACVRPGQIPERQEQEKM